MKKKLVVGLLSALMVTSSVSTYAKFGVMPTIQIKIDNKIIETDVAPELRNNTTYVPISFIARELGANVKWENPKVIIEKDGVTLEFEIGKFNVIRNGEKYPLLAEPYLLQGRTMVPIRVISEYLGCQVGFDDTNDVNKVVSITSGIGVPSAPVINYSDYELSPNQKWGIKIEDRYEVAEKQEADGYTQKRVKSVYLLNMETKDLIKVHQEYLEEYLLTQCFWTSDNQLVLESFGRHDDYPSYYKPEIYNPETGSIRTLAEQDYLKLWEVHKKELNL